MTVCCKIKLNDFKHRIDVIRRTFAQDADGFDDGTDATFTTVWAKIRPKSSFEKLQGAQLEKLTTHKITIRFNATTAAIANDDRFKFGTRFFNIQGIINVDEESRFLEFDVTESNEAAT